MHEQLWIGTQADVIIVRVKGVPTMELVQEVQNRIVELVNTTGRRRVLYEALEVEAPPKEVAIFHRSLEVQVMPYKLRRAIVVPNAQIAFLARLAFSAGEHEIFYNDLSAALKWLNEES